MLPSLDNVLSMWFTAVPVFEWEPEVPATDEAAPTVAACDANVAAPDGGEERPGMRRVFKGYEWIPTAAWSQRQSAAWELVQSNHREEDDERAALKNKPVERHVPPEVDGDALQADAPAAAFDEWPSHLEGADDRAGDNAGNGADWEHS